MARILPARGGSGISNLPMQRPRRRCEHAIRQGSAPILAQRSTT
jgi:hypothetical protein